VHVPIHWRILLVGAAAAVAVAGCADSDVSEADFRAALVDDGVAEGVAGCVTDEVFGALDAGEVSDLYTASEASPAAQDAVDAAVAACA
jgi:hypothetical protein